MKKYLIACAALSLVLSAHVAFAASIEGETNRWTFDEGTGRSANDSIGGQNGVLSGESQGFGWASGKVATALGIDGKDGLAVVLPNGVFTGGAGTISMWLKYTTASDRNVMIGAKSIADHNIYSLLRVDREGRIEFISKSEATGAERRANATKLLNAGEWYNVVFIANGLAYKVYVNGEEAPVLGDNIGRWWSQISNQTYAYRFGASEAPSRPGVWDGILDDFRVFSRELSASEIVALYEEGNAASPTIPSEIAPVVTLTSSDAAIPFGGSVLLRWGGKNIDSCTASGSWTGTRGTSGEEVLVKLGSDASYVLTCSGKGGMTTASVSVAVAAKGATTTSPILSGTAGGSASGTLTVEDVTPGKSPTQSMTSGTSDEVARVNTIRLQIIELLMKIIELQKQLNTLKGIAQ